MAEKRPERKFKKDLFQTKIFRNQEIKDARSWFRNKLDDLAGTSLKNTNMSDLRFRGKTPLEGSMIYYKYQAKGDGKLPYWDRFPLIVVIEERPKHILGLNVHYLPPKLRGVFLSALMDVVNNAKFDKTTKFKMTYQILQSASKYRFFKPCIKLYLKSHIKSNIMIIRPQQWHKAIFLPVADFKGASQSTVWNDSKQSYGR